MISDDKEKILIYSAIAAISVILIIVIVLIWKPLFSNDAKEKINTYDNSLTYSDVMSKYYENYLTNNLKITNFDTLYQNISPNYMNNIIESSDKEIVKQFLKDKGYISMDINISNISYSSNDINNVFIVKYLVHNQEKMVSIVETEPYDFLVDFSQSDNTQSLLESVALSRYYNNVNYNIEVVNSKENSINLKLTITNNSTSTYLFDFQNLNSVQLKTSEGRYVNMAMVANSPTVNYEISPNSSKSIELLFSLSFSEQLNINGIKFNNVSIDGNDTIIEI